MYVSTAQSTMPLIGHRGCGSLLVPLDGSVLAEQALLQAGELAVALDVPLLLLGVVPEVDDIVVETRGLARIWFEDVLQQDERRLRCYLAGQQQALKDQGLAARFLLVHGRPEQAIVSVSSEQRVSMIVMATHARSGWRRLLCGSRAFKVLRASHVPVLLVSGTDKLPRRTAWPRPVEHAAGGIFP